jgi:hypothetical protein
MKKSIILLTVLMLSQIVAAQKTAIIGAKHLTATSDGISILALENLTSAEIFYFTDNEYNNVTNQFNDVAESVVRITITSPISKGNVIFFKEDAPNTFTATVTPGSGSVTVIHEATSGAFSIADFGESLYVYTDNDADPTNGVTEIHSAFFPGSLVAPSTSSGGPMPATENPGIDFPNAIVVHNFPVQDYFTPPYDDGVNRVEYNTSLADRADVNKAKLENSANYVMFGNNQDLSTTLFTNFNLVTAIPIVTLTTNFSELNEDNASNFNFTFSLNSPATTNLVIHFAVSGSATFNSDYTQSGATGMNASAGTVTIASGTSSATVVLNPTAETTLEPDETIQLTITAGTGYDAGSPSSQTVTLINDDTFAVVPDVTITGTRHYTDNEDGISEFSFVALKDLSSGASYMFSGSPFNKSTLLFSDLSTYPSELKWTVPSGGVTRGDVIVVKKTAPNTFMVTKNGSTSAAGTVTKLSPAKKFYISQFGGIYRAYTDTDDNPFNGITAIHSQVYTYQVSTGFGGNIPASLDLSALYTGSVLVDGFPNASPGRLEYNPTLRTTTVDQANFVNPANWLYAAPVQDLSPIPFNNIIISEGSSNPLASVVNATSAIVEGSGNSAVFTFSLTSGAAGDITVNFSVGGSATYLTDYTVSGAATFSATLGSIVIPNGAASAQLTIAPIDGIILETSENVLLTLISGTGYDGGAPGDALVTITDDDTDDAEALVAIIGINHLDPTGLSMVALQNIDPNSTFFFLSGEFSTETLSFPPDLGIYKWTSPNTCIPKGTVLSVSGPASGPLTVNCNGTSGTDCGDFTIITSGHSFDFLDIGTKYYVYQDSDEDPSNGITQIHSVIHTGGVYPTTHTGGNLPPEDNPKLKYSNAVVVDGFPNTAPDRTEFDESKRTIDVSTSEIEDLSNYLHGQANAALSTTNFNILTPVITCVDDDMRILEAAQTTYMIQGTEFDATFSANCGETISNNLNGTATLAGEILPVGTTDIVWTVTAASGSNVMCTTSISITKNFLTTAFPGANAINVARDANIILTFNMPVSNALINANNIRVHGAQTGMYPGAFTGGGTNTITFNPANDFKPGEVITVTLTPDLGVATYSWQFTAASAAVAANFVTIDPVTTSADGAYSVYAADVDGDGDMDVLSASEDDYKIAWYENNGLGGFTAHIVNTFPMHGARSVYAADVDGDGDMDVLSASELNLRISWYENDGSENFTTHTITASADGATSVYAADVDGDGDMDVLSASEYDNKIAWYENDGSEGFTAHTITTSALGARSVYAADVDGDGDMDVLSASFADNRIAWYENDGAGGFTAHTISASADGATSVYAADVDGDGDMDVLSASEYDDKIAWYENDGSGGFTAHTITTSADRARSVYAADVDGDGDMDVLSASSSDNKITWYENNGSEGFTAHTVTTAASRAESVYAADVDGDGDLDMLSASSSDNKIVWYENVGDLTPPNAVCQNITVPLDIDGLATIVAADVDGGSTDNIGIASLAIDIDAFTCANIGENTVTLTVTDASGNVSACTSTVTVEDNIAPTVQCVADFTIQLDANGEASLDVSDIDDGSFDACGIASMTLSQTDFDCSDIGGNVVTLTVTDNNGNVSTCTTTVTVEDDIAPTAQCIADFTIQLDANGEASISVADMNDGSFDACGIASMTIQPSDFTCADVGDNVVTLTVTDNNGNISTCSTTVTVGDNIAPTTQCVTDFTIQLDANGEASISVADINDGSFDNCGINTMTLSQTDFDCSDIGGNVVILTVTDNNGNVSTCTTTVTVEDNIAPTVQCVADFTIQLDADGEASLDVSDIDNGSYDACGIASMTLSQTDFDCSDIGGNVVTLMVTDNNGNVSTCTTTVTVEDNIAPTAKSVADFTIQLDATGEASISVADINDGSFDACGIASMTIQPSDFTCADVGDNVVTLTVTDNNGNVSTCITTVTVEENIAPTTQCVADFTIQLDANGEASISVADINDGSYDACGIALMTLSQTDFDCSDIGGNVVTLTVTDNNGNVSTCTTTVTVEDNIAPTVQCVADFTIQLDANGEASLDVSDIDDGSFDACGIASMILSQTDFDCSDIGGNVVTLTVTDNNGNVSTCTTIVTVENNVAPQMVCPNNMVVNTEPGLCEATVFFSAASAFDNCGGFVPTVQTTGPLSGNSFPIGVTTITFRATDFSGNTSRCDFTITVTDNQAPVAVCQNITIQLDADGLASINPEDLDGGSTDNCGSILTFSASQTSFDCSHLGDNTITLTVTDAAGNCSTCTAIVTVEDFIAPIALCVAPFTIELDASGQVSITAVDIDAGSTDNCSIASIALSQSTFTCTDLGENEIILTVTDVAGNSSFQTTTVTVENNLAPQIVCPNDIVIITEPGLSEATVFFSAASAFDNCGGVIPVVQTAGSPSGNTFPIGETTISFTATDASGNTATCDFTITVADYQAPVAVCQDIALLLDADGLASLNPEDLDGGSTDNSGSALAFTASQTRFDCSHIGDNAITLTVTNSEGKSSTCTTMVTVGDTLSPDFQGSLPEDQTRIADENGEYILEDFTTGVTAIDNCSEQLLPGNISQDPAVGTVLTPGVYDLTLGAVDDLGNLTQYVFELTVEMPLGTNEVSINMKTIVLYPNPAEAVIHISNPQRIVLDKLSVYDMDGRLVRTINLNGIESEKNIDVSDLASAAYLVIIQGEKGSITKRLIKKQVHFK